MVIRGHRAHCFIKFDWLGTKVTYSVRRLIGQTRVLELEEGAGNTVT